MEDFMIHKNWHELIKPSGLNLKPKQIAGVLTYIRQEWGNDSSDVTEETMKNYIAQYANRTAPWTAGELLLNLSPEPLAPIIDESSDIIESQGESLDTNAHGGHTKTSFQSGKEQNNI